MTWHNAGFWVADIMAREAGISFINAGLFMAAVLPHGVDIIKPMGFMNRSGEAVAAFLDYKGLDAADLLVVCDDLNLQLGRLRLRDRGTHGGHKGLQNIIKCLDTVDFPRLRLGIGMSSIGPDLAAYVLRKVPEKLEEEVSVMAHRAADCVTTAIREGIEAAQQRFNQRPEE